MAVEQTNQCLIIRPVSRYVPWTLVAVIYPLVRYKKKNTCCVESCKLYKKKEDHQKLNE